MNLIFTSLDDLVRRSTERVACAWRSEQASRQVLENAKQRLASSRRLLDSWQAPALTALEPRTESAEEADPAVEGDRRAEPNDAAADAMEVISGQQFRGMVVKLDGRHFVHCEVIDCVLEYEGFPVVLETTSFEGCRFRFQNSAALTINLLRCFQLMPDGKVGSSKTTNHRIQQKPN